MATRIGLLALRHFTDSGLSIALDVFRAANALSRRAGQPVPFVLEALSLTGEPVEAASGLVTSVTGDVKRLRRADVILVPGCWYDTDDGVEALLGREDVRVAVKALRAAVDRSATVGASCSGTFLLAETGALNGLSATTTWWLASQFRERYPTVALDVTKALTLEPRLLCAGTVFAMADLALAVVSRHAGPELARGCMRALLLDTHPSQAPYMVLRQVVTNDPVVRAAERWVRQHLSSNAVDVESLAKHVGVSSRTLSRKLEASLGLKPLAFVHRLRLEAATHLLETTQKPLDEIAERVGYRDGGTLRRLMRRTLQRAPGELRRRADVTPKNAERRAASPTELGVKARFS